jgi:pimeloyl-ACP methyl ester carboxylesterase
VARTPLLMLPGLLLDRRLFAAQIDALAGVAEVTVADLSAHHELGALAEALLARAPARFALAGLSMGGYVALEILRRAPHRVARLALLDTQARADDEAATERRLGQIAAAEGGELEAVLDALLPGWVHPDRGDDGELMTLLRAMARGIGRDGFIREMRTIMSRPDSRGMLGSIACPTLVLCGRQDQSTPVERHEEMAAAIPRATLVVLPACGHLSPLEQPEAVGAQLRVWLESR